MTAAQRLSPAERNRATDRLRGITTGVTLAGMAATVGFSALAAFSDPGKQVASSTTSSSTTSSSSTGSTSDSSTSTGSDSATTTPFQSSVGIGSSSGGGAQAVSGGS